MKLLLDIDLPVELTNDNDGRSHHYRRTAKRRKEYEMLFRTFPAMMSKKFVVPTHNTVTRVLGPGQSLWDSSSIGRGNWKEVEDALVAIGWWPDDGPCHIVTTDFRQDSSRRQCGPAINLQVHRA